MPQDVLDGYEAAAPQLIDAYAGLDSAVVLAPIADLIPTGTRAIADLGAGTGRDAAWLAQRGHRVTAVEPVGALREAGKARHVDLDIRWLDDRLPRLDRLVRLGKLFDHLLLSGVWQHLDPAERAEAVPVLASLVVPGGTIWLSLRHGPGAPRRPVWPMPAEEMIALAAESGLTCLVQRECDSIQPTNRAAGVRWTWLALARS